jgi:AMP-binding enzyme C-terminal domain
LLVGAVMAQDVERQSLPPTPKNAAAIWRNQPEGALERDSFSRHERTGLLPPFPVIRRRCVDLLRLAGRHGRRGARGGARLPPGRRTDLLAVPLGTEGRQSIGKFPMSRQRGAWSPTPIESALVSYPKVAEAAVVGATDEMTGQAPCAFVILRESAGDGGADMIQELRDHLAHEIGAIAKPRQIMVVAELPKTRSGKIMRRLLRDVAEKREVGDVTTLADRTVMDLISSGMQQSGRVTRAHRGPTGSHRLGCRPAETRFAASPTLALGSRGGMSNRRKRAGGATCAAAPSAEVRIVCV